MITKTHIIDYSLGNLRSVYNAIEAVGGNPVVVTNPNDLNNASHVILPGVGAFGDGIKALHENGWVDAINLYIKTGKSFLGICLGMQLLATNGFEHGENKGLDIISGNVKKFMNTKEKLLVPHVGWNDVVFCNEGKLSKNMSEREDFYFVHSYCFYPKNNSHVKGYCEYGDSFPAILEKENVFATQFHPEKSQKSGLQLLKNFTEII